MDKGRYAHTHAHTHISNTTSAIQKNEISCHLQQPDDLSGYYAKWNTDRKEQRYKGFNLCGI